MTRILQTVGFFGGKNEGGVAGVLAQMLGGDLVAGDGVVKALAGGSRDVGSGEIGGGAAVGVGGAEIGEVGDHGEVVLVAFQRGEAFGHADFFETAGFFGIEGVIGEAEAAAEEDHALCWSCNSCFGSCKGFEEGQC